MPSSSELYAPKKGGSKRRSKTDKRTKQKKSTRKRNSESSTSSIKHSGSAKRSSDKSAPRMSLAAYKAQLPPLTEEDKKMNELCAQLGLQGGEYRDGYYVRYIEVPAEAPKPKVVYEDRVTYVDVPEIDYVHREIEEFKVEEIVKEVPKYERVEVPKTVDKYVEDVKYVTKEIEVPVPGKVIDVPAPYDVPKMVLKPQFHDQDQQVVVAQVLKPVIRVNKKKEREIEAYAIDPVMYPVDIYVPFPVQSTLDLVKIGQASHKKVDIPEAHYNSLVNKLNETVPDDYRVELFKTKKGKKGSYIPMLPVEEKLQVVPPVNRW